MKISISYPPLDSEKGIPLLSQNRQFQWFKNPTYIYPVVPAYAATLLKSRGHHVCWDDGIAEGLTYDQWYARIAGAQPEIIVLETKTPVVKKHWKILNQLKKDIPDTVLIMVGDHVTAFPEETMDNSPVDYIITGGDYDFILADLCDCLASEAGSIPKLPGGIWFRDQEGGIQNSGALNGRPDLNTLPIIDRDLTRWDLYAHRNGNFKYTPGTYIMAGRDCWWGRCTFCSWTTLYPRKTYRTVSVDRHIEEITGLVKNYGIKEIFDDSGCFPTGRWLEEFCEKLIETGLNKKVTLGCNMRVGALSEQQWRLMKKANFRFILIGLESVNQSTLDRMNKGIRAPQIEETIKACKKAGLEPHITTMVGYPWESKADAEATIKFAKRMFTEGFLDTLQATIVVPYPGTPLFEEAKQEGWLLTENWDDYDMKQSVWNSPVTNEDVLEFTQELYRAALSPAFIAHKLMNIRSIDDLKYIANAGIKVFAHIKDFNSR